MARIAPFCGLRYNLEKVPRLEDVVTPPYDVIDENAQAAFLKKNPLNMIQLDLCKNVATEGFGDERYLQSKNLLEQWQAEGVFIRDSEPTLYLYFISYRLPSGQEMTRKGLVALAGLAEFSEGIVKPHEKTFRGVVTDRLRLLDTCQTQFSQIFSLYSDPENAIMSCLEAARSAAPLCSVTDQDGHRHALWPVTDPAAISQVCELFADKSLYIADGHHRYTTALQLRELMRERHGRIQEDSPYNHTMMYLCGMEDPGLSILPTHRLARLPETPSADQLSQLMAQYFLVEEIREGSREMLIAEVLSRMDENLQASYAGGRQGATMFGMYHPVEDRCFLLTLQEGAMTRAFGDQHPQCLRNLDVVVLSDLILEHILELSHDRCEAENRIDYFSDPDNALDRAVKESAQPDNPALPVLFLMNPTTVYQVKEVADENLVMPHKSTFFYPKILTGLVLNKIVADERICP